MTNGPRFLPNNLSSVLSQKISLNVLKNLESQILQILFALTLPIMVTGNI